MLSSETEICNQALAHLGERPIASLEDGSVASRACRLAYDRVRNELLRQHRWNFAVTRAVLSRLATAPLFGWNYQYALPADCLRALEVNDSEFGDMVTDPWTIEGRVMLTNAETVNLIYVREVTDVSEFDDLFAEALSLKIAIRLSEIIRGSTGKTNELGALYERSIAPMARGVDSNEGRRRKGLTSLNSMAVLSRSRGSSTSLDFLPPF